LNNRYGEKITAETSRRRACSRNIRKAVIESGEIEMGLGLAMTLHENTVICGRLRGLNSAEAFVVNESLSLLWGLGLTSGCRGATLYILI
jgi:hypothetical protein